MNARRDVAALRRHAATSARHGRGIRRLWPHAVSVIPAGGHTEVDLTVNGAAVRLRVSPRLTLADALRGELGLTGTHLGCEHGVCGMCTVLVDGEAARSCLLFAAQLDGGEIVTVEGLGTPDDQHPLQEAFAHHHALQCGFCTPGFLLSAYDLLAHRPDVAAVDLPAELSGVLCRCTGYRNILAAVEDVARRYPDGLPGPRNCRSAGTVGRRGLATAGLLTGPQGAGGEGAARLAAAGSADRGGAELVPARSAGTDGEVVTPLGEPTLVVDVRADLAASAGAVWAVMDDMDLLARCLPGAELTGHLGGDRYRATARVGLGAIRLSFAGVAEVVERDVEARRLTVRAQGADARSGATQAEIRLVAQASGSGSRVSGHAKVWLSGRIAQFGRALAGDVGNRMFEQFAVSLDEAATTGTVTTRTPSGPGPLALVVAVLRRRARERLASLRAKPAPRS